MSAQKVIPGLDLSGNDVPDVEVTLTPIAQAVGTDTLTPKPVKPRKPQELARMATSKAELLAQQNYAIATIKAPSKKISRAEWAAYRIDQYISTKYGQIMTLTLVGLAFMVVFGVLLMAAEPTFLFADTVWQSWTFLADPCSHTTLVLNGPRVVGVITSLVGILYFSVIMGFVVDAIREKMDMLKKGKSSLAEEGHTLLLGWSDKSVSLIRQISLANVSEHGGTIVVLADTDKEVLEAELESQMKKEELQGTKVIIRTGTPMLSVDLLKVSAHRARCIIIMANSTGDADRSDAAILRTVLSLKTLPELSGHIVAELRDIDNDPLLRLVGGKDVEILVSHDVIGRLVLMSARSPGLARVYASLLGFEGNEFYFKEWPECVGVSFNDLAVRFPNAVPLGIKRKSGEVFICPSGTMTVEQGDEILVLAEDDDTYKACPPVPVEAGEMPEPVTKPPINEQILMCGWRRDIRDMLQLLDAVVHPGTEVTMLCEEPVHLRNKTLLDSGLDVDSLQNSTIVHHVGNTAIRRQLEKLPWHKFTSIMILSDQALEEDIMHSDSHSLASLLLIRDLQTQAMMKHHNDQPVQYCKCISEILDPRTQRTISTSATILQLSEFIQSNELVSCILAMISENRDVRVILDELLGPRGAYVEVEPSSLYCEASEKVSFWQLAKRAASRGDILCGFQVRGVEETVLNPEGKHEPRVWGNVDVIIVRRARVPTTPAARRTSVMSVNAEDFEQSTRNRQLKDTFSRQRLLSAMIQDTDLSSTKSSNDVLRALTTFSEDEDAFDQSKASSSSFTIDRRASVRSLIAAARMLADALEHAENVDNDEAVTAFM